MSKLVMFTYEGQNDPIEDKPWLDQSEDDGSASPLLACVKVMTCPRDRDALADQLVFACVGHVPRDVDTRHLVAEAYRQCRIIDFKPGRDAWFTVTWCEDISLQEAFS